MTASLLRYKPLMNIGRKHHFVLNLVYCHPELSGCITALIVRNTGRLQTLVQQWTP